MVSHTEVKRSSTVSFLRLKVTKVDPTLSGVSFPHCGPWFLCIYFKTKIGFLFLSLLFKCSVYLLLSTVIGGAGNGGGGALVLGPTPAPQGEDLPPGRARRWAEAGCV